MGFHLRGSSEWRLLASPLRACARQPLQLAACDWTSLGASSGYSWLGQRALAGSCPAALQVRADRHGVAMTHATQPIVCTCCNSATCIYVPVAFLSLAESKGTPLVALFAFGDTTPGHDVRIHYCAAPWKERPARYAHTSEPSSATCAARAL